MRLGIVRVQCDAALELGLAVREIPVIPGQCKSQTGMRRRK